MDFLIDFVNEFEFILGEVGPAHKLVELLIETQVLADDLHRREQNAYQQTRIERGGLACIPGEHAYEQAKPFIRTAIDRQHEQSSAGGQRAAQKTRIRENSRDNVVGQFCNVVVDLIIVDALTAPDTAPREIVKTKALCTGHQRLQQSLRRVDISTRYDVVHVCEHRRVTLSGPAGEAPVFGNHRTMPCNDGNRCDSCLR